MSPDFKLHDRPAYGRSFDQAWDSQGFRIIESAIGNYTKCLDTKAGLAFPLEIRVADLVGLGCSCGLLPEELDPAAICVCLT